MKATELRQMSDEQLQLTLQETTDNLFRKRIQSQTEKLSSSTDLKKARQIIARIKTIQTERMITNAISN